MMVTVTSAAAELRKNFEAHMKALSKWDQDVYWLARLLGGGWVSPQQCTLLVGMMALRKMGFRRITIAILAACTGYPGDHLYDQFHRLGDRKLVLLLRPAGSNVRMRDRLQYQLGAVLLNSLPAELKQYLEVKPEECKIS